MLLPLYLLFWLSFRAKRANLLSPIFARAAKNVMHQYKPHHFGSRPHFLGDANKEREEAGSLAALGMTTRKTKALFYPVAVLVLSRTLALRLPDGILHRRRSHRGPQAKRRGKDAFFAWPGVSVDAIDHHLCGDRA